VRRMHRDGHLQKERKSKCRKG